MGFDLERFVDAQRPVIDQVRRELAEGRKRSHWMWFVFPQLRGLGHSDTARYFGLAGIDEAAAFLRHPVLGECLIDCTELVRAIDHRGVHEIFGSPDDLKFHSCMTLFNALPEAPACFGQALSRFFAGAVDPNTMRMLD